MSRYLRLALIALVGVSCVLLFLLVSASQNSDLFEKYYTLLLWVNLIVTLFFFGLVSALLVQLYRNARRKKYGVKILSRFAVALGLTGVIPGVLIFIVSVQFLHKSVDSWFDMRVERALDSGLTLGREVLENYQDNLLSKARIMATELSEMPPANWVTNLYSLREKQGVQEALLVTSGGNFLAVNGASFNKLVPAVPSNKTLQTARARGHWQQVEEGGSGRLRARVIVPIPSSDLATALSRSSNSDTDSTLPFSVALKSRASSETVFLELADDIPPSLANNAETLMNGYRDYQEMTLARSGLRNIYLISLTLVLLMSMFSAIAASVIMANRISQPLMRLLEGTRRVGEGQYETLPEVKTNDEVGELTHSFNMMTNQLSQTRKALEKRGTELEQAKDYLERILAKMSSGVIVLDEQWKIVSANSAASRIMHSDLALALGKSLREVLPNFVAELDKALSEQPNGNHDFSFQSELALGGKSHRRINVFTRGTHLPIGKNDGYLLVFDDVTALVSVQRTEAWGEVARRLAHEIKNPLTPIQLAAERLQMKLEDKVTGRDQEILNKATGTIVNQVGAMKQMVDDFRLYAKIGAPRYESINLSEFVEDVINLYRAADFKIKLDLDQTAPNIEADPNQLRQIIHNLLSNALEAKSDKEKLMVAIRVYKIGPEEGFDAEGVAMEVDDNGSGFTAQILEHAFEPYVTTKASGTGLGLAIIKKIADEHGATVTVDNRTDENGAVLGARISFIFTKLA